MNHSMLCDGRAWTSRIESSAITMRDNKVVNPPPTEVAMMLVC